MSVSTGLSAYSVNSANAIDNSGSPLPTLWFIVPAAGVGKRVGANIPKQYLPFVGSTVIETTLKTLLSVANVAGVVVAIGEDDGFWSELEVASNPRVHSVIGGKERSDSVLACLDYLSGTLKDDDWVLVHDAARPCIHTDSIHKLVACLVNDDVGGILATPASDTLKRVVDDGKSIGSAQTIDRSEIYQAQTPQMFRYRLLYHALTSAYSKSYSVTDEASALEFMGQVPKIVEGRPDNIKITHPEDVALAEWICLQRNS